MRDTNIVAVIIGVASFFLMPTSPARTKSWWNPKEHFTEKEQKIIVNSGKSKILGLKSVYSLCLL